VPNPAEAAASETEGQDALEATDAEANSELPDDESGEPQL
jgi:hypothetical protein